MRYDWKINGKSDLKVALEYTGSRVSAFPTLTGRYTVKEGALTALAQGFVNEKSVDVAKDTVKKVSWGAGAGLKYQLSPAQSVQANYQYIVGDQKFMPYTTQTGLANATSLNAAGDFSLNAQKTDLLMNKLNSLNIGYSYKFNPQWRANLSASIFDFDDDSAYAKLNPDANKRLKRIMLPICFIHLLSKLILVWNIIKVSVKCLMEEQQMSLALTLCRCTNSKIG